MDDYELQICDERKEWNDFVATSSQGNIFCQTQFLDAHPQDYELLFIRNGGTNQLGALIAKEEDGQSTLNPFMYQGVLFDSSVANFPPHRRVKKSLGLVDYLLAELEQRYDRISFSLHHSFDDLRSFQWFHYHKPDLGQFKIDMSYTGILSLSDINNSESILMNARTVRRQEFHRALREGFLVEESNDVDILNHLHGLTFQRQARTRSNSEEYMATKLAESAISNGFGRLMICKDKQGTPASASLFLFDDKCGYYLIGANDPKYRKYGTGSYVLFEQIRWCLEQGLTTVDFVGINSPLRGDFKTSFNAVPMPYYTVTWKRP